MSLGFLIRPPINITFLEQGAKYVNTMGINLTAYGAEIKGILLQLDAAPSVQHSFGTQITDFPLEDGELAQDNSIKNPRRLTIDGIITDTPTTYTVIGYVPSPGFLPGVMPRSVNAFQEILKLWKSETPFDVVTAKDIYKSMMIEDFSCEETAMIGKQLKFTMSLKQVTILDTETIRAGVDIATKTAELGYLAFRAPDAAGAVSAAAFMAQVFT